MNGFQLVWQTSQKMLTVKLLAYLQSLVDVICETFWFQWLAYQCYILSHPIHVCDVIASDGSVVDHADDGDAHVDLHSVQADDSEGKYKSEQKSLRAEQSLRLYEYIWK